MQEAPGQPVRRPVPRWRRRLAGGMLACVVAMVIAYGLWSPGIDVDDGRHDRGRNGLWLQHGWLANDAWLVRNQRDPARFRDPAKLRELAQLLRTNHITDIYPHLCPCSASGSIAPWDATQTERLLDELPVARVMPWVGGVLGDSAKPDSGTWRAGFVASVSKLLREHPRLAGVHVNIEPMPSGHQGFLVLLAELRATMPPGKILSVAAYPPPTLWQPAPEVHWTEDYFRAVAQQADQIAVMMYDTSIRLAKPYENLMSQWTREVLLWAGDKPVLLGVPAYDDAESGYHHPDVENLRHALRGVHAGLIQGPLPANYQGVAIYCEWEMDDAEWRHWRKWFVNENLTPP